MAALCRAKAQLCPDETWVIPAKTPPHKELAPDSPNALQRLELTKLAFAGVEGVTVSDMELRREDTSYTVDTLRQLAGEDPLAETAAEISQRILQGREVDLP